LQNYFSGNFWALSRLACSPKLTTVTNETLSFLEQYFLKKIEYTMNL